ncbi:MAG TPA: TonB-dependent receptor, partial [Sphingomonadaceae bacterium]|nr:TonB-dependent receptor [Sphingomonadaceae bacterium]
MTPTSALARIPGAVSLLAIGAVLCGSPSYAQDNAQPAAANESEMIVVTGSRVARAGFESPTPLTVVGQAQLQRNADTNIGEALNRLPSFRPQNSGSVLGFTQANTGSMLLDLRGLGAQRTLVLVDGRRSAPSTTQGTFDISLLPSNIVSRAEVVTGGASAAYGSDAVAGVVNLILDTHLEGFRAEGKFGVSTYGGDEEYQVNAAYGSDVANGRGHFVIAGEYVDSAGMKDCFHYKWCSPDGTSLYFSTNNPGGAGADGRPGQTLGYVHMANMTQAGLISSGPLRGTQFNADGSVSADPYVFGLNASPSAFFMIGGSGRMLIHENLLLKAPFNRFATFANLDYDVTDSISAFVQASYGRIHARANGAQPFDNGLLIQRDNAFLPDQIAAEMDQLGIADFTLGRQTIEAGLSATNARRSHFRITTGLRGPLGGGWDWDAYYQYGETSSVQSSTNNRINANFRRAIDSVIGPDGQPVCRSTLADPSNGCSPINPFGIGHFSPAALNYAFGTAESDFNYTQHVLAANLRGTPFNTWAGPVSVAAGAEYRSDKARGTADQISTNSGFFTNNAAPIDGNIAVVEGYMEAVVPLATDFAFAHRLELNGAVRQTHYSRKSVLNPKTTVDATTWKIGGIWEPVQGIRFRATRSRDIRAPNMVELFSRLASTQTFVIDRQTNTNINVTTFTGGNP